MDKDYLSFQSNPNLAYSEPPNKKTADAEHGGAMYGSCN
jgi:hypothetical protein